MVGINVDSGYSRIITNGMVFATGSRNFTDVFPFVPDNNIDAFEKVADWLPFGNISIPLAAGVWVMRFDTQDLLSLYQDLSGPS